MPHRHRFSPHRTPHHPWGGAPTPPPRYVIVLKPQTADGEGHPEHGPELRKTAAWVTGEEGASGYPRYAGDGLVADVDPRTRTVEAVTVDGEELPYGWVALVADDGADDGDDAEETEGARDADRPG